MFYPSPIPFPRKHAADRWLLADRARTYIWWLEQLPHVLLRLADKVEDQRRVLYSRPVLHALVLDDYPCRENES